MRLIAVSLFHLSMNSVVVCLPVFNEVHSIANMIDDIRAEGFDIIVTDGGSTDGSLFIAEEKKVKVLHRPGKSKAFGMKQAMQEAQTLGLDFIVFIDCDLTYPTDKIKDLLVDIEKYDMVLGARNPDGMSLLSRWRNILLNVIMNFLFGLKLKDCGTGFRAMRIDKFLDLLTIDGIDLEIEICGLAGKKGYSIKEVDVDYFPRVGESKLTNWDIINALLTILKVFFRKY